MSPPTRGSRTALASAILGGISAVGIGGAAMWVIPRLGDFATLGTQRAAASWHGGAWPRVAVIAYGALVAYVFGNALRAFARWYYGWGIGGFPSSSPTSAGRRGGMPTGPPLLFLTGSLLSGAGILALALSTFVLALTAVASQWRTAP